MRWAHLDGWREGEAVEALVLDGRERGQRDAERVVPREVVRRKRRALGCMFREYFFFRGLNRLWAWSGLLVFVGHQGFRAWLKFALNKGGQDLSNCEYAYKRYMCYMNFPRCDDEGKSLILCRSVCENYANACGISKDLNRCGPNEFYGAEEPEIPELDPETKEESLFIRGMWPGWPFRDYQEMGLQPDENGNLIMSF